jgi:hypothetical protein
MGDLSQAIADIDALKRHGMSEVLFCNDAEEVEYEDKMLDLHAKACAHVHEMSARNAELVAVLKEAEPAVVWVAMQTGNRDLANRIKGVLAKNGGV